MPAGLTTRCLTFRDIFVCTQHPYLWCSPTQASQLTLAFKRGVATLDGGSTLIYGLFQKSRVLAQDGVEKKIRRHLVRARLRQGFGWKRWMYATVGLFTYRVRYLVDSPKDAPAR